MRKIYSTLKSVVAATLVAAMAFAASCSYDDTAIKNDVEQIKDSLEALTQRVANLESKLQTEIDAVKALIDGQVVIVDVTVDEDGNQTIKLSNGKEITVLAPVGCDCEPATPCTCDSLQYRTTEEGVLEVSADGVNWVAINGVTAECVVASIVVKDGVATITLADGTVFETAVAELVEFEAAKSAVYVKAAQTLAIPFAINDAVEDINVMNTPLGWKAEVVDTRAVGGMDYVLNITGPAKNFLEYAEKSGKVAIHFNTAAGACKVMSVDVELAEITMDVDKAGNVTIVNTLVDKYERENWGVVEYIEEFNNFYFAVLNYDDYYEYEGRLEEAYNSNLGEFFIPAAASYVQNFFTNVGENGYENAIYQDGVNEKWTLNFTVEEAIAYLDWYEYLTYEGNSFVLCVIPTDVNNNGNLMWDEIVAVPFKQLSLNISENVDNRTFQQPYFNVAFRGAQKYFFYPQTKSSLEDQVSWGYYDNIYGYFEEAFSYFLMYPDWYSFGYEVTADIVEENISLAELLAYTYEGYYYETIPGAEYVMAYFAWEEGKTEYTVEDLRYIEFSTADVVKAESEHDINVDYNDDWNIFTIAVDVTVPDTTAVVYTAWFAEEPADEESMYDYLLSDGYSRSGEDIAEKDYTFYVGTSCSKPETAKYLGVLVIDAEGKYTLKSFELKSAALTISEAEVTIESVEFTAESATITVGGVEDYEVKGYQYYIISKTSGNSYYMKSEEQLQDIAYGNNYLYKSSEVNPIVVTQTSDYKTVFNEGEKYAVAVGVQFADGSYSKAVYGEFDNGEVAKPEPIEMGYIYRANYKNGYLQFFGEDGNYCARFYTYEMIDANKGYLPEGTYSLDSSYGNIINNYSQIYDYNAKAYTHTFDVGGKFIVSEVDGAYRVEVTGTTLNGGTATLDFVYEGAIENLILPSEYKEPVALDFVPVFGQYDLKCEGNNDSEYGFLLYDAEGNYLEVTCFFNNNTGWNYVYSAKYVAVDGTVSEGKQIQTQAPNDYDCNAGEMHFVAIVTTTDYAISFNGNVPAEEVNFWGADSSYEPGYQPGGDNEGGDDAEESVLELVSASAVHADANKIGGTGYEVTFVGANGEKIMYRVQTKDKTFLREGDWNSDFNWAQEGYVDAVDWTGVGYPWPYAMTVAVVDDNYDIVLECMDYNNDYKPYTAHFVGQIEGFTLPVAEEVVELPDFVIPGEGETFAMDYKYTDLVAGLDENNSLRVCQANGWIWDIKFNSGLTEIVAGDYKAGGSSFSSADALEVDTYNGGFQNNAFNYIYPEEFDKVTTFNVQKEGDFYCITMIGSGGYGNSVGTFRCVYIGKIK